MDLLLPVLLVTLLYAVTAGGSGPRDYYLPRTPARKALYESCMNKGGCVDRPTDFLKGTCYLFCFFDQNDDGYLTTEDTVDEWNLIVGRGKAAPHSLCDVITMKAAGYFLPPAFQDKVCTMTEHLTKHAKGVMTISDLSKFMDLVSEHGTVPVDLEQFTAFSKALHEATIGNRQF